MEQFLGNDGLLWPGGNSGCGEEGPRGSWIWRQRPAHGQPGAQGLTGGILSRGGMQLELPLDLEDGHTRKDTVEAGLSWSAASFTVPYCSVISTEYIR